MRESNEKKWERRKNGKGKEKNNGEKKEKKGKSFTGNIGIPRFFF